MRNQAEANFHWFQENLSLLLEQNRGSHVLLHDCAVAGYFASSLDAIKEGMSRFGEGNFSVEAVDDKIEDLGFYSHVGSALHA